MVCTWSPSRELSRSQEDETSKDTPPCKSIEHWSLSLSNGCPGADMPEACVWRLLANPQLVTQSWSVTNHLQVWSWMSHATTQVRDHLFTFDTYHHTLESFVLTALNSRCHTNYKAKMPKSSFACLPLQHPPIRNPHAYLCPDLLRSAQHQTSWFAPISCLVTYYPCLSLLAHSHT